MALLNKALVLFGHGARDPQWADPLRRLQNILQTRFPYVRTELAFLELMQPSLPSCVQSLVEQGVESIQIVPIFFGKGGHLAHDFPVLMTQMHGAYPQVEITATQAVGQWDAVWDAIAIQIGGLLVQ